MVRVQDRRSHYPHSGQDRKREEEEDTEGTEMGHRGHGVTQRPQSKINLPPNLCVTL
ncbi:protein of unknown function [Candidatus Promineifilum breve]|uniref:Uncharacterized protein n=1 Tax=Candidatus Promineifilum breve TaxID=1806508 RepID=A0A160T9X0_9CHLR|nr:protein of unknown function [Candidatus Promineifilum breve]